MTTRGAPYALALLGAVRHYGYYPFPADWRADVCNIMTALVLTILVWAFVWRNPSPLAISVATWFSAENALVAGCSAWFIYEPWVVQEGDDQCTARFGPHLGAFGLAWLAWIAVRLSSERRDRE